MPFWKLSPGEPVENLSIAGIPAIIGRQDHGETAKFLQQREEQLQPAVAFGRVLRQPQLEVGFIQEQPGFKADLRRTYSGILGLGQQQPTLTIIFELAGGPGRSAREVIAMVEAGTARKRRKR